MNNNNASGGLYFEGWLNGLLRYVPHNQDAAICGRPKGSFRVFFLVREIGRSWIDLDTESDISDLAAEKGTRRTKPRE
jgi:hypothetical protein